MPTAIEVFKLLPKKNCGKCNFPTCLAFAMQIANSKAKLDDCPFVSDEAKMQLAASAAPPIRLVRFGSGKRIVEMGDETELYRHEKKFFHPTAFAGTVSDALSDEEVARKLETFAKMKFERVGQILDLDAIAVKYESKDPVRFTEVAGLVALRTDKAIVLRASSADALRDAAARIMDRVPLLDGATKENHEAIAAVAKELKCPLVVRDDRGLNELAGLVSEIKAMGVEDIVLDVGAVNLKELLERSSIVRKVSVKKMFRGLGYPMIVHADGGEHGVLMGLLATMKYGSLVVFDELSEAQALPLFVLRQNIFTDPQVPIQVKPGVYPVNNPTESAPLLFTTNFSLTYFTVLADIEKSKVPVWLQVVDTEGLSVMTAYSAGKLTPESVSKALDASGARDKSKRGEIVIPGMVSRMSGKLQDATGLKVTVGPKESSGLPKFLKSMS
ncbi:MAG TPA: acetyl-CoA decarbonylase/synthase complex subunit gamma [Methanomassiliicoccales archaeon]|nr:acetyl-CoA decarbonylase/synthase complex subunit gamma [Methanomassiliicoccales archaeon]